MQEKKQQIASRFACSISSVFLSLPLETGIWNFEYDFKLFYKKK